MEIWQPIRAENMDSRCHTPSQSSSGFWLLQVCFRVRLAFSGFSRAAALTRAVCSLLLRCCYAGVGQNHGLSFTQFADVICTYLLLGTPQKAEDQLEFLFDCFSTGGARRSHFFGDGGRVDRSRRHASQQVTVTTNLHVIDVDSPEDISVLPARRASNEDGRPAARSIGQLDEPYLNRDQLQQLLSLGSVYPNTPVCYAVSLHSFRSSADMCAFPWQPDIQATLAQLGGRIGSVLQHMGVENKNVLAAQGRSPNAHVDSSDLSADLRLPFPQFAELCHLHPVLLWALNRLRLRVLNIVLGTTDW